MFVTMSVGKLGPETVVTTTRDSELSDVTELLDGENVGSVSVEDVMTEDPATIHEDDDPLTVLEAIAEHNVRRFPIVDDDGELVGIATLDDLIATIGEELDNVAETIEAQSPEYSP